jgi:hypothetical protein
MGKRLIGSVGLKPGTDTGFDLDEKGQIHGYTDTQFALPVGDDDQVLTADSGEASGIKWAVSQGLSSPLTSNLVFNDGILAAFGTGGGDSYIKHDGSNFYIKAITGSLYFQSSANMSTATCITENIAAVTISSGQITGTTNVMSVDTEGSASSDDLDAADFTAAGRTGAIFSLKAANDGRTVVVKDTTSGTGLFLGSGDMSLDNGQDVIMFGAFFNLTNNYEISRSNNL